MRVGVGTFTYNGTLTVDFEDRLLVHLQLVISAKLRRNESFMFSWTKPVSGGGGRTSIWIDKHLPMAFDYDTSQMPSINRGWVDELMETTYRSAGLQIVPESGSVPAAGRDRAKSTA